MFGALCVMLLDHAIVIVACVPFAHSVRCESMLDNGEVCQQMDITIEGCAYAYASRSLNIKSGNVQVRAAPEVAIP